MKLALTPPAAAALAALMLAAAPARAADVIDQHDDVAGAFMASFAQGGLAQSFQPLLANSSGAGIFLRSNIVGSGTVTIGLWDALPNAAGAHLLASGAAAATSNAWVDVFWAPVAVTPNTTYVLSFESSTNLALAGDTGNGYSRGNVYANAGYQPFAGYDYTFRTYFATGDTPTAPREAAPAIAAVPEPATWAMMVTGFGTIGASVRRRRRRTALAAA